MSDIEVQHLELASLEYRWKEGNKTEYSHLCLRQTAAGLPVLIWRQVIHGILAKGGPTFHRTCAHQEERMKFTSVKCAV